MDYPPDWMLFDMHKNQDVDPKFFPALARYYVRYLEEYQKQGIFIDYLSLFNEPDVYTKIRIQGFSCYCVIMSAPRSRSLV